MDRRGEEGRGVAVLAEQSVWDELGETLSPLAPRPRVVPGIESVRQTTRSGEDYVVIRNPAANTYLKLDPLEFDLLPLMDGSRTVKDVVVQYYEDHGVLAAPRIIELVDLLREERFLTEPPIDAWGEIERKVRGRDARSLAGRVARAFMQSEKGFSGVDARVGRWYRAWGHLFFTRRALVLQAGLGVAGIVLFLVELARDRYSLFQVGSSYLGWFVLASGVMILGLALHELGHAFAAKRAGRHVGRAGVMLYYGFPAAYVDTTDVWMASREQRIIASAAGPWTGFVLGGLCAIAAYVAGGVGGSVLFASSLSLFSVSLFNLDPLLEFDGYYMLIDILEKPMLRARSLAFVRGPLWTKLRRRERFTGEERLFTVFGSAAATWSVATILLALWLWERRLHGLARNAWRSGSLGSRIGVTLVILVIAVPLFIGLWALLRPLPARVLRGARQLDRRAALRRHREALAALQKGALWREVPELELLPVARAMRQRVVDAGTEVVRQGERGDAFFVIAHGVFEVLVDGRSKGQLRPGDYFGERALLRDEPRAATVIARERGRVFALSRPDFERNLAHDVAERRKLEEAVGWRDQVARMPLFDDLSPTDLDLLVSRMTVVRVGEGAEVIRQGEIGSRFYAIRSGSVDVVRNGEPLATLGPGQGVGEVSLLHGVPATATVTAREATDLLALEASDFRDVLAGYLGRRSELERLSHSRVGTHRRTAARPPRRLRRRARGT